MYMYIYIYVCIRESLINYIYVRTYRAQKINNNWPLAIFQPILLYGQSTFIFVDHIYCTFAMK